MTHPTQEPDRPADDESGETAASSEPIEEEAESHDNVADEGVPTDPGRPTG